MKKKTPTFEVTGRIVLVINKTISAENMEAAVVQAKTLKVNDFLGDDFGYEDASLQIAGLWGGR